MKSWYREAQSRTARAVHVGASSTDHKDWSILASKWIIQNDPEMADSRWEHDWIDLNHGRDYLTDPAQGDIVILEHIFAPDASDEQRYVGKSGRFSISPRHSKDAWRSRLSSSGAKYVFAFGSLGEVSGEWIGDIPGYEKVENAPYMTVYRRTG